ALKNTLAEFLHRSVIAAPFRKFILDRIDFTRADGERFAAWIPGIELLTLQNCKLLALLQISNKASENFKKWVFGEGLG
ncbi:MAG: hypothetical protein ACI957_005908, partial [Verrucomicrobiales bacterium]